MKTISDYSIYCTPEQTGKALELGAPLYLQSVDDDEDSIEVVENSVYNYYEIPTAEEMIGWLEDQKYISSIEVSYQYMLNKYCYYIFDNYGNDIESLDSKIRFNSRKEATLAAINAALEYLMRTI